jgi:peroxiredoxin
VAVFAVNLKEDADTVKPFVKRKGWSLPVLLDLDGDVAKAYLANAIPETVVIGKDGVVKKVFVGSGNEDGIKAAVEAELKR